MHDDRQLLEARLTRFVHDHLEPAVYRGSAPLTLTAWPVPGEPVPFREAVLQTFRPIEIGTPWGRPWSTLWIHVIGSIPANWAAVDGTVPEVVVDLGFTAAAGFHAEGLAYRPDGTTIKAVSPFNNHVPVEPGEPIDIYLEAAANPDVAITGFHPTPNGDPATLAGTELYVIKKLALDLRDIAVWELRADILTLAGLMNELPVSSSRRAEILVALQRAIDAADPDDIAGTAAAARAELAEALAQPASASAHRVVAVGHAHIDSAWLWPVRETIRKCARTFSNVVQLADADPAFIFACSSAQQLAWIKQYYPDLFDKITEKVRDGQFVPDGGMWVESDTNMTGGEAMARQFVAGKSFFLENFGVETEEVWLPDSFGYSAALPQIMRASGSRWFLTQKISWNQINTMPHHTFWWEGIDGSRVFTHFPPADTYNAVLSGAEMASCGSVAEHIAAWTTPLADPAGQTSLAAPSFPARTGCQPRPARRRQLTHDRRRRRPGGTQRLFADRKPFLKRSFQPAPQPGVLFWHANEHGRIYRTLCGCNGGHVHDHLKRLSGDAVRDRLTQTVDREPHVPLDAVAAATPVPLSVCSDGGSTKTSRSDAAHVRNPPTAHHVGARRGHGAR